MHAIDFTPLHRFAVGFDRMQRQLDAALTHGNDQAAAYPPYNIEMADEDSYRVTMAVAGFSSDDLDITVKEGTLYVSGTSSRDEEGVKYLHRGIAGRSFERRFQLAEHIEIVGASLADGLLHIDLKREIPEAMKPRTIAIDTKAPKALETKKAA